MAVLDGDDGYIGKHNMLHIIEHSSIPLPTHIQLLMNQATTTQNTFAGYNRSAQAIHRQVAEAVHDYYDNVPLIGHSDDDNGNMHVAENARVYYRLPLIADLRFHRQWHWLPTVS